MKSWMGELANHYEMMRHRYPDEKLMIVFDIDGTILDTRYMVRYVLQSYDRFRGSNYFRWLRIEEIVIDDNDISPLLERLKIPEKELESLLDWYDKHAWSEKAVLEAHRPFNGVLEVMRFFNLQPNTYVGFNTARPVSMRKETLSSINKLGEEYKLHFTQDKLALAPRLWVEDLPKSKADGIRRFQDAGYRVFAMIDNEPDNLKAIGEIDPQEEILLLQADTILESKRNRKAAPRAIQGRVYDITELIKEKDLPSHIQLVWHGVNDSENLRQFLASDVFFAEMDVRPDPVSHRLILRHDDFQETPLGESENLLPLNACLAAAMGHGRGVKLDLRGGGDVLDRVASALDTWGFSDDQLWFNGQVERVEESGFRYLAQKYPEAIIQCPIDFLSPLILGAPENAREILDLFSQWGINRFSIDWKTPHKRRLFDRLEAWGHKINIYNVPDLHSFLKAALLLPSSITADFNFPKWHYFGRGPGEGLKRFQYDLASLPQDERDLDVACSLS